MVNERNIRQESVRPIVEKKLEKIQTTPVSMVLIDLKQPYFVTKAYLP